MGDIEGRNLTIERYSGEARPDGYPDLARAIAGRNPDVIVAITNPLARAVRAATEAIPIVWIGVDPVEAGLAASLAHPGGKMTGVSLFGNETYAKRLQILKDGVPSVSKVAYLSPRGAWEDAGGQALQRALQEVGWQLQISLVPMLIEAPTPSEYQRVFAEIAPKPPDALIVSDIGDLVPDRQLIVELAQKSRLPAIYGLRAYVEAGGLMAYGAYLNIRTFSESPPGKQAREELRKSSLILEISLTDILVKESTSSEYQRVFAEFAQHPPDAIIVSSTSELFPYRKLIVELAEKSRLPAIYPFRDYAEAGGLMAYETDIVELFRRMADDVHQILNEAKPVDSPIYRPTKFELLVNLKAAKALGLTIPPMLLATADEVIE